MWLKDERGNYFMEGQISNPGFIEDVHLENLWTKDPNGEWILYNMEEDD